jgi:hypothetical protein
MNQQDHAGAYRAATNAAMDELDLICQESKQLTNLLHQLDIVVEMLKPLIGLGKQTFGGDREPVSESMEMASEPVYADGLTPQTIEIELPKLVPQKTSKSQDPIQRRIDSMLGRAVA